MVWAGDGATRRTHQTRSTRDHVGDHTGTRRLDSRHRPISLRLLRQKHWCRHDRTTDSSLLRVMLSYRRCDTFLHRLVHAPDRTHALYVTMMSTISRHTADPNRRLHRHPVREAPVSSHLPQASCKKPHGTPSRYLTQRGQNARRPPSETHTGDANAQGACRRRTDPLA